MFSTCLRHVLRMMLTIAYVIYLFVHTFNSVSMVYDNKKECNRISFFSFVRTVNNR